jgi:hypothetical protein
MDRSPDYYIEITGRIASSTQFCEFLDAGGKVLDAANDAAWRDVTFEVLQRERRRIGELERIRRLLYPDLDTGELGPQASAH